jgi:signal transduction histidine kinase/ActR/RegA family two-component response regulator
MTLVDPQTIRSEQHTEVGNLLLANVGIVIERWSRRAVAEQPNAQRVHHDVLLDHLTELLQTLSRSLAESEDAHTRQHCNAAAKHGEQRWDTGWSLPEVIRDYQILRLVILDFLEESLARSIGHREVLAIGLAIDESIAASVVAYVKDREKHLLKAEQQRTEDLQAIQARLQAQAEALQEADHRKNDFLALLAHELRNPLAPVRNALHIIRLKGTPDPELQWAREVIERQAQHMTRMVDDLFDISRIARGKVKLEKAPVDVATIVERALEEVRPLLDRRKHELTVVTPSEPTWLDADRQRLTQVLVNILVNAVKYTNDGGQVHLAVARDLDDVVFKVRDTGIGIPAELLPRIFEPFTQEEQSAHRIEGGLGIGLALVRKLVELHEGRVDAFSGGRGQGSEFVVRLPMLKAKPAAPRAEKKSPLLSPASPRRILVVDDNHDAARSLAYLLTLHGHEVHTANDGPTALALARSHGPEIILLDIGMPRMDGLEVARRLRQEPGLKDIVLVALTGYGQDQDRRRSQEAGFDVHLVKPIELDHLQTVLLMSRLPLDEKNAEGGAPAGATSGDGGPP